MFGKKIHIEKLKDNRIFILFSSLYDVSDRLIQNKLTDIAEIFATKFLVEITSKDKEIVSKIAVCSSDFVIKEENKCIKVRGMITTIDFAKLLCCLNFEESMVELYTDNGEYNLEHFIQSKEKKYNFYMCVSDNDGPFIIFHSNIYNYQTTIAKIKALLTQ